MTGKACGYYSMDSRIANAAIVHNINFTSMHGETLFDVNDFFEHQIHKPVYERRTLKEYSSQLL